MKKISQFLIPFIVSFLFTNPVYAFPVQSDKLITLQLQQVSLSEVFSCISEQSEYRFSYNAGLIDTGGKYSICLREKSLEEALSIILPADINYKIINKHIILFHCDEENADKAEPENYELNFIPLEKVPLPEGNALQIEPSVISVDERHSELAEDLIHAVPAREPDNSFTNIRIFNVSGCSTIDISYNIDHIAIYESKTDELILKEYLKRDDEKYSAFIQQTGEMLKIKNGKRFLWFRGASQIEIYLPKAYSGNLKITNLAGEIKADTDFILNQLVISNGSGDISIQSVIANTIELKTASGKITANDLDGHVYVGSTAGRISIGNIYGEVKEIVNVSSPIEINAIRAPLVTIKSTAGRVNIHQIRGKINISSFGGAVNIADIEGGGDLKTTTGSVDINFTNIKGDIFVKSLSGSISFHISQDLSYYLALSASNGSIRTNINGEKQSIYKSSFNRQIGNSPEFRVEITTTTGNIIMEDLKL